MLKYAECYLVGIKVLSTAQKLFPSPNAVFPILTKANKTMVIRLTLVQGAMHKGYL